MGIKTDDDKQIELRVDFCQIKVFHHLWEYFQDLFVCPRQPAFAPVFKKGDKVVRKEWIELVRRTPIDTETKVSVQGVLEFFRLPLTDTLLKTLAELTPIGAVQNPIQAAAAAAADQVPRKNSLSRSSFIPVVSSARPP